MTNNAEMALLKERVLKEHASAKFIDGYFTARVEAGEEPIYGYPPNHLPHTKRVGMSVIPSFLAKQRHGS